METSINPVRGLSAPESGLSGKQDRRREIKERLGPQASSVHGFRAWRMINTCTLEDCGPSRSLISLLLS